MTQPPPDDHLALSRRAFLGSLGAGALGLGLWGWSPVGRAAWALGAPRSDTQGKRLVVVLLRGAVDGLSVLVPYAEAGYQAKRSSILIQPPGRPGGALALAEGLGLHPAMGAMHRRWAKGELGFVPASGALNPTRSHFEAQAILEAGLARGVGPEGWMNRLATALGASPGGKASAVALGEAVPLALSGPAPVACSQKPQEAARQNGGPLERPGVGDWLAKLYASDPQLGPALTRGLAERRRLRDDAMAAEAMEADADAPPPEAGFAQDAHALGGLLRADAGLRLGFVALGGWDTHVRQGGATGLLANRLKALSEGLDALALGLGPAWRDTVVVVLSEFGRTVAENGGGGTDHGHGTPLWVLGGGVDGGRFWGSFPGLEPQQLHEGRDLAVTVERRGFLAGLLAQHFGLDDSAISRIFPGLALDGRWRRPLLRA